MAHDTSHTNALIDQTSPYLLQHAHNPVDWQPWGPAALARARQENRPILLSIGYSACHWCHVMAHESFEDPATAELMNRWFINIKVDREERPDLDKIYQRAHQLLTQRPGGWPLTMFLMPEDQVPFFGGTYFPKEPRFKLPSFKELLQRIAEFYQTRAAELREQNESLMAALRSLEPSGDAAARLGPAPLDVARRQLEGSFDQRYGGFGQAPKFPHCTSIERLLRHWAGTEAADQRALEIAAYTLRCMGQGGVNDQIGGGFCRYSVDDYWMIPHFEKMLYDNGPLLSLYAEAWSATAEPLFEQVARHTASWVMREMQAPEGGYYSSLDADSEGEEGKFYVWQRDEVRALLSTEEYALFARRFGLDREANFEGAWYPHVFADWDELSAAHGVTPAQAQAHIDDARAKLFAARAQRVHPGRDDKILGSWNALMIKGMANAGRRLDQADWIDSAQRALDFVRNTLWQDGRLLATYKDGRAHLAAYLDDYVFLMDAVLELLQSRWRDGDLDFAVALAEAVLEHFADPKDGGFYFTADDHEQLIQRPKPMADESVPAGNGVAAYTLARLGHLLGESRYLDAAQGCLQAAWPSLSHMPQAHNSLLLALEEYLYPPQLIVLRGGLETEDDDADNSLAQWQRRCAQAYAPRRLCFAIPAGAQGLPGLLAQRQAGPEVRAYVCHGTQCLAPIEDLAELEGELNKTEAHATIQWS